MLIVLRRAVQTSLIIDQILIVSVATALLFVLQRLSMRIGERLKFRKTLKQKGGSIWVLVCALSAFILYGLAGPAAIERSKSAYVIKWVGEAEKGIDVLSLNKKLVEKYGSYDMESVELRLEEQESRRLINQSGESYSLTLGGRVVYESAELIAIIYSLTGWETASLLNRGG